MRTAPLENSRRMEILAPDDNAPQQAQRIRTNRQTSDASNVIFEFSQPVNIQNKSNCLPKIACASKYLGSVSIGLGLALLAVTLTMSATLGTLAIPLLLLASGLILFSFFSFFFSYEANNIDKIELSDKTDKVNINLDNIEQREPQPIDNIEQRKPQSIDTKIKVDRNLLYMDIPENLPEFTGDLYQTDEAPRLIPFEQRELIPSSQQLPRSINSYNIENYRHLLNSEFNIIFSDPDNLRHYEIPVNNNINLLATLKENGYSLISQDFAGNRAVFINEETNKGFKILTPHFSSFSSTFNGFEQNYSDERLNDIYNSPYFYEGKYSYLAGNKLLILTSGGKSFLAHEFIYDAKLEPLDEDEQIPYSVLQMMEKAGFIFNDNKPENFLKMKTAEGYHYIPIDSKLTGESKSKFYNSSLRTREIRHLIKSNIDEGEFDQEDPKAYYRYPSLIKFN